MTCKDCIHYDVCSKLCTGIDMNLFMKDDNTTASESCPDFKDKSKFIELPFKVGDNIYYVELVFNADIRNYELKIKRTKIRIINIERGVMYLCEDNKLFFDKNIGKDIFLTREEAEEALKARN